MLKHATGTPRSSPNLSINDSPQPHPNQLSPSSSKFSLKKDIDSPKKVSIKDDGPLISSINPSIIDTHRCYNERGVDCDGIFIKQTPLHKKGASLGGLSLSSFLGDKILNFGNFTGTGNGIGPVITHGKAIVRRGLSFNTKKDTDAMSIRSVKSEGPGVISDDIKRANLSLKKAYSVTALDTSEGLAKEEKIPSNMELEVSNIKLAKPQPEGNSEVVATQTKAPDSCNTKKDTKIISVRSSNKKIFGISKNDHPSLKSLLRLPGVYGHIPVPEGAPTGSPHILSPDSLSLNSADSFVSSNSGRISSRSWSSSASSNSNNTSDSSNSNCSSTSEPTYTTLRIFAKCLRSDIEYKTVNINSRVTCRQLINLLLSKAQMRHRDPKLFYLTMEVTVRRWSGVPVRALLVLEESANPAKLALCRPSGELKFVLQMRKGGVIKVRDTVLMPGSQYKSLLVSYQTSTEETVQLLLNCYGRKENKHYYALHEVCVSPHYRDRRLGQLERPLEVKAEWPRDRSAEFTFVLRRNMAQALSLRKLSLRTTLEHHKNKEDVVEANIAHLKNNKTEDVNPRSTSLSISRMPIENEHIEETVIDCTNTMPFIITFTRDNSNPNTKTNSNPNTKINSSHTCSGFPRERDNSNPNTKTNPNRTWSGVTCEGEQKLDREHLFNKLDATHPLGWSRSKDFVEKHQNTDDKAPLFNLDAQLSRWKNIEDKITSNLFTATVQKNFIIPSQTASESKENTHLPKVSKYSQLRSTVLKNVEKNNPELRQISETRNRHLSTSAVQTELTCIPLKGLHSTSQKWNSVETLIDTSHRDNLLKTNAVTKHGKSAQEDFTTKTFERVKFHNHGTCERNCKDCFYI